MRTYLEMIIHEYNIPEVSLFSSAHFSNISALRLHNLQQLSFRRFLGFCK